ncbi:response regulator [Azospirillum doebereinerae]|uniref:Response regulator n=1 Tax=Azospirillum doebereinerae TaxID=92933 RepID=A0A3S0V289_9PROT|nr:response regulator [Azospirillum doebereinerae]RUQ73648.1 response regulator [Azospirillum doebereinerae]
MSSPDRPVAPEPAPESPPEPPESRLVLVVEDSPLNQMIVAAVLAQAGYRTETANNGLEAVMAAQAGGFDLILMDVSMPEMDGLTATRLLRGLPGAAGLVPVVAMTADTGDDDRARCLEAGMNDHVAKPIDRAQLLDTVARWLRPADGPAGVSAASSAPDAAVVEDGVLDREVLPQLERDLGADLLAEVLRQFVDETLERVARIAGQADLAALTREAHTLKSTAGTFGAQALCVAARALEMACRDGAAAEVEALRGDIPRLAGEAIAAYRAAGRLG